MLSKYIRILLSYFLLVLTLLFTPNIAISQDCKPGKKITVKIKDDICNKDEEVQLDEKAWKKYDKETLLSFFGDNKFWIIPSTKNLYQIPASQSKRVNHLVMGVGAIGSAASILVKTGNGEAFIFDVGSGVKLAIYRHQMQNLAARMNVSNISHAHISHNHKDHYNRLKEIVETFNIPAARVNAPPLELPPFRGVYNEWNKLAETHASLGYRRIESVPNRANNIPKNYKPSPRGRYLIARYTHGDVEMTHIALRGAFKELAEAAAGGGSIPSAKIDSTSPLVKMQKKGDPYATVILGDLRGQDYQKLKEAMEAERPGSFNNFFRNVRLIKGINHHAGVVRNQKDVDGILSFVKATRYAKYDGISIIVQTKGEIELCDARRGQQLRPVLVEALTWGGFSVTVVNAGTETTASNSIASSDGAVSNVGPNANTYALAAADAELIRRLRSERNEVREWHEIYNNHKDEFGSIFGKKSSRNLKGELDKAMQTIDRLSNRLENLLYQNRTSLNLQEGEVSPLNHAEIRETIRLIRAEHERAKTAARVTAVEDMNAMSVLQMVRRGRLLENSIRAEIQEMFNNPKRSASRLLELMEKLDVPIRRKLRKNRQNLRNLETQLTRAILNNNSLMAAGSAGASSGKMRIGGGVAAAILLIAELGQMGLEVYDSYEKSEANALQTQFEVFKWWIARGAKPTAAGWEDRSFNEHDKRVGGFKGISDLLKSGKLAGIHLYFGDNKRQWFNFMLWITSKIRSYDDYVDEFIHIPQRTVKHYHESDGDFPNGDWRYRKLWWDRDAVTNSGSRKEYWVTNKSLNRIMKPVMNRAVSKTESNIEYTWARREKVKPSSPFPVMKSADGLNDNEARISAGMTITNMRPTSRAKFKPNAGDKNMYSHIDVRKKTIDADDWWDNEPYFLVFENDNAPSGYVLVSGANFNTYAAIRSNKTWKYQPEHDFKIGELILHNGEALRETRSRRDERLKEENKQFPENNDNDPTNDIPFISEVAMINKVKNNRNVEFIADGNGKGSGYIRFWFEGNNHWALGLVKKSSLNLEKYTDPTAKEKEMVEKIIKGDISEAIPDFTSPKPAPCPSKCGRINCDCSNIKIGIITNDYRKICRDIEAELKLQCEINKEEIEGTCDDTASGPNAWPK